MHSSCLPREGQYYTGGKIEVRKYRENLTVKPTNPRGVNPFGMASSKVIVANTSTSNPDLPRQHSPPLCPSLSTLLTDLQNHTHQLSSDPSSSSMDDFLKNIYFSPNTDHPGAPLPGSDEPAAGGKSVADVWKEIVAGDADQSRGGCGGAEITLEDFLTRAGAMREGDVIPMAVVPVGTDAVVGGGGGYGVDTKSCVTNNTQFGNDAMTIEGGGKGGGRVKRRVVEEPPLDKATQQKQRRMIKNRESAARSRERKQAYTVELESLVTQLEEENARLLKEEADQNKDRYKQLMENIIPVIEKPRPPRVLRRVHSSQW